MPLYPTFKDYVYPKNFLTEAVCIESCLGFCVSYLPSACSTGPENTLPKFDYIIVGAGPSGLTIANRLSTAHSDRTVLLIESGDVPPVDSVVPTFFPFLMNIESSYSYRAEPNVLNIDDRRRYSGELREFTEREMPESRYEVVNPVYGLGYQNGLPCDAGKGLGGGTIVNAMLWVCGTSEDYDGWKSLTNDSSWGWGSCTMRDGMCFYYKKAMNIDDPDLLTACSNYLGTTGPVTVKNVKSTDSAIPILKEAAKSLNYPLLPDINCGKWIGMANIHMTIKHGERDHAARAYLAPLYEKQNLFVMLKSKVAKVILHSGTKRERKTNFRKKQKS